MILLVQANGAVVEKDTLAVRIWPQEEVSDGNLAQHVYLLRQLLGERARDHSFILTVPGRGYRFTAPVVVEYRGAEEAFTPDAAGIGDVLLRSGVEPFRNYCQGSFLLEKRTAPALKQAAEFFEAALRSDPDYTPALIGIARAYALLAVYWHTPAGPAFERAGHAISRVLELDPSSSIAHAVRSGILCFADWNWAAAKDEIDLAIQLNPGSTFVRNNAAWLHICTGQYEEALAEAQRALTLEPSSLALQLLLARALTHGGDYRNAVSIMSNLLESDPAFYIARRYRAQAYLLQRKPEKAIDDLSRLPQEPSEDPSFRLPMLGRAYADAGDVGRASAVYAKLRQMARTEYVVRWNLAIVAAGLGLAAEAMAHLDAALAEREPTLPFLKSLPWFESLNEFPEFGVMLHAIGP
ncbi:MAG: tetratricopeptide repeat protein [Candidatus Eremiobacteraeota bacterium]|nr:tetratricopeptide repeat protein [Candidatus Eremiobacteraeota bacterium]